MNNGPNNRFMMNKNKQLLPGYAVLPICMALALNYTGYIGCRILVSGRPHISLACFLDDLIPFQSAFVIFYFLAFAQWIFGYILIGRESVSVCDRFISAEMIAKMIAIACFLIIPTTIVRPEVTGSSWTDELVRLVYRLDAPDNLFPSIHCLESWVCFRSSAYLTKAPRWYRPVSLILTLFVFASTVCLKQHVFADIPGGILAFEIGWLLSEKLGIYRGFEKLRKILKTLKKEEAGMIE